MMAALLPTTAFPISLFFVTFNLCTETAWAVCEEYILLSAGALHLTRYRTRMLKTQQSGLVDIGHHSAGKMM
jgi:hypothetical protein